MGGGDEEEEEETTRSPLRYKRLPFQSQSCILRLLAVEVSGGGGGGGGRKKPHATTNLVVYTSIL